MDVSSSGVPASDAGIWKVIALWAGYLVGSITLSKLVLMATLVLTLLQIWKTLREMTKKAKETT